MSDVSVGEDTPLLDLLDALVSDRGRTAARVLGVNYRTMMNCYDSRQVSRLRRQVAEMEERAQIAGEDVAVDGDQGQPGDWRPPRRGHGLPDAGVVTLEEQPDEEQAFGPAVPLVAEWREVRARMGYGSPVSRVDRAVAAVRRWELEVAMLREFHLTLPPETEPLNESKRQDHVRWREEALAGRDGSWGKLRGRGCCGGW